MMPPERLALHAVLRSDLGAMVQKVFNTLHPGQEFVHGWHIDAIVHAVMDLVSGRSRRLVINIMPRSLKSIITSVALPAWLLGHNPSAQIICASYSDDLAEKFSRDLRTVMQSRWYREAFPYTRLDSRKQSAREVATTKGGFRLSTSVGGTLTGRGADWIIIDDPLKAQDALSEAARRTVKEWFDSTVASRLNNQAQGRILLVMQRLHQDDLAGHLIEAGWPNLVLQAQADEDRDFPIRLEEDGALIVHRMRAGDLLDPERMDAESLSRLKSQMGSIAFAAQYQQSPVPPDGNIFKRQWFRTYDDRRDIPRHGTVAICWDCASKPTDSADWSVCTIWQFNNGNAYLLDVVRGRWAFPELVAVAKRLADEWRPNGILIEEANAGVSLIQVLQQETKHPIIARKAKLEKEYRAGQAAVHVEAGKVFLPAEASWLAGFLQEVLAFPNGRHDDQVDSMVHALLWDAERPMLVAAIPWYGQKPLEDQFPSERDWSGMLDLHSDPFAADDDADPEDSGPHLI
ncbi:phage terminase large subunit [Desertibaculum subflavum]|uniref:phage terminase large subunit n=1 Tax=Desertibaculum subflavum TaxID=2268458 RepID=UPI000E665EA0